jgi:16S rRNA (cytidine1402-2'-O)-methyltransferase
VTLVVAGASAADTEQAGSQDLADAVDEVAGRVADGASRRDAIAAVAAERGLRRRTVYDAVVRGGQ